jgi:DNA-binding Lrp family transcriptional regulator
MAKTVAKRTSSEGSNEPSATLPDFDPSTSPMYPTSPAVRRRGSSQLDDFDLSLINCLVDDGRASTRKIAETIGLTESTVASRLRSLMERKIVRVRAVVDWQAAGFTDPIVFFLRVTGRPTSEVLAELKDVPEIQSTARVFGSADIIIRVLLRGAASAVQFTDEQLSRVCGVSVAFFLLDVQSVKYLSNFHSVTLVDDTVPEFPDPAVAIDECDRDIIRCLVSDARHSWRQVGRTLGISESTVRLRVRRLEACGLLRVIAQLDPVAAGNHVEFAWIGLKTQPGAQVDVLAFAVGRRELSVVARTIGQFDLLVFAVVDSRRDLAELLEQFRAQPGIVTTETWTVSTVSLSVFPWARLAPQDGESAELEK